MSSFVDLSSAYVMSTGDTSVASGSIGQTAAGRGMVDELVYGYPIELSASQGLWPGSAISRGAEVILTHVSASIGSGSWYGTEQSWGVSGGQLENHDKTHVVSDANPNVEEGLNTGEYNPFSPPVAQPAAIVTKDRDATRYGKAYSFSRNQPVRIRIYKR